jgi:hypothetical protein
VKTGWMRVVRLVNMAGHAVGQRGVRGRGRHIAADHRAVVGGAFVSNVLERVSAGSKRRARDHRGERVEQVESGALLHFVRQRPRAPAWARYSASVRVIDVT